MELFFIILLVLASIAGLTIIVERGLALRWRKVVPRPVEAAVENYAGDGDFARVRQVCQENASPLSRLLLLAAQHRDWPKSENGDVLQTRARHEVVQLERGLVILEIIVGISPLLGLVGTIYGLIMLFGTLGQAGLGDHAKLASGIALALNSTLLGLLTAIPSLVAWSYYNKKVESLTVELERLCEEFMRRLYQRPEGKAAASPEKS